MPVANFQAPGEDLKKANPRAARRPELDLAIESWRRWTSFNESILTRHWTVSFLTSAVCNNCSDTVDSFSYEESVNLGLGDFKPNQALHIRDILERTFNTTETRRADGKGYDCGVEVGEQHMDKSVSLKLARLPPLLCFRLMRFESGQENKNQRPVGFPINGLDMTNYAINTSGNAEASKIDGFGQERLYDLYAVICHIGDKIEGGHYMAYVRDGNTPDTWFECNDTRIFRRQIGKRIEDSDYGGSREPIEKMWFESVGRSTPFLLFYKRRDKPWEYPNGVGPV
jgi:ubiquitin C-terminal hydrolase